MSKITDKNSDFLSVSKNKMRKTLINNNFVASMQLQKIKKERKYQESENFVNFSLSFFVLFEKFVVIDMKIIVMVNISQN